MWEELGKPLQSHLVAVLQPEELLALRRDGRVDQDLGPGEQERAGRDPAAGEEQDGPAVGRVSHVELGRQHALRGQHGWRHLRVRDRALELSETEVELQQC